MVYNDINESNYSFKYDDIEFYFSSNFYREKFIKQYSDFLNQETIKLRLKYRCFISCDLMILLLLYKRIEKRGFRVIYKDKILEENYYIECNLV